MQVIRVTRNILLDTGRVGMAESYFGAMWIYGLSCKFEPLLKKF